MAVRDIENIVYLMRLFALVMELVNTQATHTTSAPQTVCSYISSQSNTDCNTTTIHINLPENFCKAADHFLPEKMFFHVSGKENKWKSIVSQTVNCSQLGQRSQNLYLNVPLRSPQKTGTSLGDNMTFYIHLSILNKWGMENDPCNTFSQQQIDLKGCNQNKMSTITTTTNPPSQSLSLPLILTLCVSIAILFSITLLILCRRYRGYRNPPESGNDEIGMNNYSSLSQPVHEGVQRTALVVAVPDSGSDTNNVGHLLHQLRENNIKAIYHEEHDELYLNVSEWSQRKVRECELAIIPLTSSLLGLRDSASQLESPDLQIVDSILLELHTQSKPCATLSLNDSIREDVINLLSTKYKISIYYHCNEFTNLLFYIRHFYGTQ